jgi:copper transport protein
MFFVVELRIFAKDDTCCLIDIHTEKDVANVTVSPGRAGPVDITIQLETIDELPLEAKAVSVTLSNMKAEAEAQTISATQTSDNEWLVRTSLSVGGRWMLGLGISLSETDKVDVEAPILVK